MKALSLLTALLLMFTACEFERSELYDEAESAASQQDTLFNLHPTSVTYDMISLAWNTVPDAQSYTLFRDQSPDFIEPYAFAIMPPDTVYTDSALMVGTTYYYKVCALYSDGGEDCSREISVRTPSLPVPQNLRVVSTTEMSVSLAWNAVSGVDCTYVIYRDHAPVGTATALDPTFTDEGLTAGSSYTYFVTCNVSPYGEGGESNWVTGTPQMPPAPGAPGNLTIVSSTATSVTLSWSAAPDLGDTGWYDVWWADNSEWKSPSSANAGQNNSFEITGLGAKVNYYCKVIANNNYGMSPSSEIISDGFERISYQDIFQDITNYPSMYMSSPISVDQFTVGDIFWYSTNMLLYGKFQILNDVSGGTFQIRYVTYNAGGTAMESFSDNISIPLNYAFDLDTGVFNSTNQDFFWGGDPLLFVPNTGNEAKFKELPF